MSLRNGFQNMQLPYNKTLNTLKLSNGPIKNGRSTVVTQRCEGSSPVGPPLNINKIMKKKTIYTNEDNEDFTIEPYTHNGHKSICFEITTGNYQLYFSSKNEVHDFCEILMNQAEIVFPTTK